MSRIRSLLSDSRFLSIIGVGAVVALLFLGAKTLKVAMLWAALASIVVLLAWLAVWLVRRRQTRKSAESLGSILEQQGATAKPAAGNEAKAEIAALQTRMQAAVKTIKGSKIGQMSGAAALYELPWYITIGNPAAGKSTAIVNSGLTFPFDDGGGNIIKGIGGTRNCDWFFTTEGILLDTAGRYSVHEEDRAEWLGFLGLLKKHRSRAPINGVVVTVSIGELIGNSPNFAITLAKNLRQRVQELTENLEVFAPVYVLFTKADLIPGFHEFFQDLDWNERDRVWGSTLPYDPLGQVDAIAEFNARFDELYEGVRALSVAQMSRAQGDRMPPSLLTFPSEFAAVKPTLRVFLATLFEENPFQFKPIFRGFYITSALQNGETQPLSDERIAKKFSLTGSGLVRVRTATNHGFFLKDIFSKVIFTDRNLVRQYASKTKTRLRQAAMLGSLCLLGLALGGWSWSLFNNSALTANVQRDLEQAVQLQEGKLDLQSRLRALEILQDRLNQIERFNADHPFALGLGLYQGDILADKLRREYFAGVQDIMLKPVQANIEAFLSEVNAHAGQLKSQAVEATDAAPAMPTGGGRRPVRECRPH
jgi:type VI secretion system protein ImpL